MSDELNGFEIDFSDRIHWPEGIDESVFLSEYWQQKPLLIRQAFPDFDTPLPADELAGLSLEPDSSARLITRDGKGDYHLEHGPFDEDRFAGLTGNDWSLLVTDVEKWLPQFATYLQPFRFIPDWRIDDLMVSYAPNGASVGAHIDEYDVFLLQASGTRTWHIDSRLNTKHELTKTGDLKILSNFQSNHTWDLQAGDMLYLPPNIAHHGIANGDHCMTWSIGFRAPLLGDMVSSLAELVSDTMPHVRYTDGRIAPSTHGEIHASSVATFKELWNQYTQLSDADFTQLLGRWLTEPAQLAPDVTREASSSSLTLDSDIFIKIHKSSFSRFAWNTSTDDNTSLFVDGNAYPCTQSFAVLMCSETAPIEYQTSQLTALDTKTLESLLKSGSVYEA